MSFKLRNTKVNKITMVNSTTTWRTYDGSSNNLEYPQRGVAKYALERKSPSAYADGISSLAVRGSSNPSPRRISNLLCAAVNNPPLNDLGLTNMMWAWGQFIDHEVDLTESGSESVNITCSALDPNEKYPGRIIPFKRSLSVRDSSPRQQPNDISAFIDGTNIYGFNSNRAYALREMDGSGKLKTAKADNGEILLPYNTLGLSNGILPGTDPTEYFLSGDIRTNENLILISMHTLFMKEHNRLCDKIVKENPQIKGQDEMIFNYARRIVIGLMENITFIEFLPPLVGELPAYSGYKSEVDPTVVTEFSTVGYRIGHSMLSSKISVGDQGESILLRDAFFKPSYVQANGTENLIFGITNGPMKKINNQIIDDIRNFLFEAPTSTMLHDLPALNMQRGRDHGIPGYNELREAYGLSRITNFSETISNSSLASKFKDIYSSPDNADPWVAAISEDHVPGLAVGPLIQAILKDQFIRLRDGDRFWFECDPGLSPKWREYIKNTTLGDIIRKNITVNTGLIPKVRKHVFVK